jgi:hypothetical protein
MIKLFSLISTLDKRGSILFEFRFTCVRLPRYSVYSPELTCAPTPLLDLIFKELDKRSQRRR